MIVETERHEKAIYRITLNRPEKRNALSFEMCRQLAYAFKEADSDPAIRAIVLTANGTAFCSGMDLHEVDIVDLDDVAHIHNALFNMGKRIDKPIIAAVNGDALAGGTGLVANAHVVIAGPRVAFGLTEIKIGLWPFLIYKTVAGSRWRTAGHRVEPDWANGGCGRGEECRIGAPHLQKSLRHSLRDCAGDCGFQQGRYYKWHELHSAVKGENLGGVRPHWACASE